ncbi:MAG: hypothetical protein L6R30_24430 [Thermoanaerobaculia bacterium]|nr:hypothetical protein [Thermoanaerobaculia bacterium]
MKHLFGKVAFKISKMEYLWEDVFLDAELRGAARGTVILGGRKPAGRIPNIDWFRLETQ